MAEDKGVAEWWKGTMNHAPDTLLHSPVGEPEIAEMLVEQDEDSKPEMSISQLRTISNENRKNMYGCRTFTNMQNSTISTSLSRKSSLRDSYITKSTARIIQIILASSSSPHAEQRPYYLWVHLIITTGMCRRYWASYVKPIRE